MKNKYKIDGIADSLFGPWHPWSPLGRAIPLYWLMVPVPPVAARVMGVAALLSLVKGPCPQLTSRACARHGRAISQAAKWSSSCCNAMSGNSKITLLGAIKHIFWLPKWCITPPSLCCQTILLDHFSLFTMSGVGLTLSGPFTPKAQLLETRLTSTFPIDCIFEKIIN